jgi:hypothetical protein
MARHELSKSKPRTVSSPKLVADSGLPVYYASFATHSRTPTPRGTDMTSGRRITREKKTITAMMAIYCRDHHPGNKALCTECNSLLDYAHRRLDTCPFQEEKPACNLCEVHCYSAVMRERVRDVMRYAGPRMLGPHPILSLGHILDKLRPAPKLKARRPSDKARP